MRGQRRLSACLLALAMVLSACSVGDRTAGSAESPAAPPAPLVIAHRGDSSLPENTLGAFERALEEGADYLETDVVSSSDGRLVLRHERGLAATTDVEHRQDFAGRRTTKQVGGRELTDWFVEDFTLAELRTLRATSREQPPAGNHRIATVQELIELATTQTYRTGRQVGLLLETKQSEHFADVGLDLEPALAEVLRAAEVDRLRLPVVVQSFDCDSVMRMEALLEVAVVQLVGSAGSCTGPLTSELLEQLADERVDGVAVRTTLLTQDPDVVDRAHDAGLDVLVWTIGDGEDPSVWLGLDLDGLITDDAAAAVEARTILGG